MTHQFSAASIEAAIAAQTSEKLKWSVRRYSGMQTKFRITRIPEWGKSPVTYGEYDNPDDANTNMEPMRNAAAMRAALAAALEVEGK